MIDQLSFDDDGTGQAGIIEWDSNLFAKDEIIVKVIRRSLFQRGMRVSDKDMGVQKCTLEIVREFNSQISPTWKLYYIMGALFESKQDDLDNDGFPYFKKCETRLVELLKGNYEKWNSNVWWANREFLIPNFLSHW